MTTWFFPYFFAHPGQVVYHIYHFSMAEILLLRMRFKIPAPFPCIAIRAFVHPAQEFPAHCHVLRTRDFPVNSQIDIHAPSRRVVREAEIVRDGRPGFLHLLLSGFGEGRPIIHGGNGKKGPVRTNR